MQAKCWPYLRYRANSQCIRVCHTTLPPYHAASRSGSVLSIYSHPHQPRDTNQHDWNFPFVTDRIDRMCSVRILSADTTQRPWALLFFINFSILNSSINPIKKWNLQIQIASWATEVKFTSSWVSQLAIIGTFSTWVVRQPMGLLPWADIPGACATRNFMHLVRGPMGIWPKLAISTHYTFINPIQTWNLQL